jgi:hypothetical protein
MKGFGTKGLGRVSAVAVCGVIVWASLALPAWSEALDTSRLPRVTGARDSFASAATTIYFAPDTVARVAEATRKALAAGGWQSYVAPHTARAQNANMEIMSFKKGPQALNVFVSLAPAQNNATSVNYTAVALPTDLPFPVDATDIEFDPNRPLLFAVSADATDKLLAYYRKELGALGWSLWSAKVGGKQPDGGADGERTEKGAFAYYIRENKTPLVLVLQQIADGRTKIEIKSVLAQVLADARQAELNRNKPPEVTAAPAPAPAKPQRAATDDTMDDMMKQAMQMARQATADALSGAKTPPPAAAPAKDATPLRARATSEAPVPVPDNAEDIEYEAADGKLEYSSAASVPALTAFYRNALKPLGWQEHKTVINRPNMVVLEFSKAGKKLSFTVMQMGPKVNVTAEGSGLVTAAAKSAAQDAAPVAAAPASADDLIAEETGGLPVPKRHTLAEGTRTPFRQELKANVPLDLTVVLNFYRRELEKRSWKVVDKGPVAASDKALVTFTTPDGAAVLKLGRKDNETTVSLAVRNPDAATKAGIMPKPGQVKVLFGNITEGEAVVTIAGKTVKIAAGIGVKKPDGPTLDLAPGKYKVTLKLAGKPAKGDDVEVGADEAWGLMIGPGGVLALNVY